MHMLHLTVLAIVFSMFVAACATTDPKLLEEHSDRPSDLEEKLDEISAWLSGELSSDEHEHEDDDR